MLLGLASWPAHAEDTGLGLTISASKSGYEPGEPIELTFTVTNRGPAPCQVVAVPDGALYLTSVTRDGVAVPRLTEQVLYNKGYGGKVRDGLVTVSPHGSASFTVVAVASGDAERSLALRSIAPLPDEAGVAIGWHLNGPGRYEVAAGYAVPRVNSDGPATCAGTTGIATASFSVGETGGFPWLLVIIGGVATAVAGCFDSFSVPGGDPAGIIDWVTDPDEIPVVRLFPSDKPTETFGPYSPEPDRNPEHPPPPPNTSSTIQWNWQASGQLRGEAPGVTIDPCAELYHELVHAYEHRSWPPEQPAVQL